MTVYQKSIEIIFNLDINYLRQSEMTPEEIQDYLENVIPGSYSYWADIDNFSSGEKEMKDCQRIGFIKEKKGDTLYMFSDEPGAAYFFSMNEGYAPLVESLEELLEYYMFYDISAADMVD